MNSNEFYITCYKVAFTETQNFFFDDEPPYTEIVRANKLVSPFSIALNTKIKIDISANNEYLQKPNYIKLEIREFREVSRVYYFYVLSAHRIANAVLELSVKMDVLNTFKDKFIPAFSPKTIIKREHVNRFSLLGHVAREGRFHFAKIIDRVSEGLTPKLYEYGSHEVEKSPFGNFYLIYKTNETLTAENLNNAVSCYLCADDPIPTGEAGPNVISWTNAKKPADGYYYAFGDFSIYTLHGLDSGTYSPANGVNMLVIHVSGDSVSLYSLAGDADADALTPKESVLFPYTDPVYFRYSNALIRFDRSIVYYSAGELTFSSTKARTFTNIFNSGVLNTPATIPFASLGRDDSRIMKIIKLPYAPTTITETGPRGGIFELDGFTFNQSLKLFKLNDISKEFGQIITTENATSKAFETIIINSSSTDRPRNISDPKLLNSDFYNIKFNYDNFSLILPFERLVFLGDNAFSYSVEYKPTNTINSKFMFKITPNLANYEHVADYDNVLLASRNNEITLFTNDYLNYLRSGYNYDKKTKAVQDASSAIGGALGVAGGVGAIALGVATDNTLAIAGGIASIAGAFTSTISSTIQRETSFEAKQASLMAKASSVAGVDDMDLFDAYGHNALRISEWKPSELVTKYLDDLFYYYGYTRNVSGTPNLTSRIHFNFLECDAVFNDISTFDEYADEIKNKLSQGVTYFHKINNSYDLKQTKENYETALIPIMKGNDI